jgi:hypothetical protein
MKAGDIVFVRGHGIIDKAIEFFDKGQFSHCAIAVSETEIVESQYGTRVKRVPMTYTDIEIVSFPLTPEQQQKVINNAMKHIGQHYDILAIVWYVLTGKLSPLRPNHEVCSELVTMVLTESGLWSGSEVITPNGLYKKLKTLGGTSC